MLDTAVELKLFKSSSGNERRGSQGWSEVKPGMPSQGTARYLRELIKTDALLVRLFLSPQVSTVMERKLVKTHAAQINSRIKVSWVQKERPTFHMWPDLDQRSC